jgi:hypothetical protein
MKRLWTVLLLALLPTHGQNGPVTVPFDVCAQSDSWSRPSPGIQSKIWNDPRYREPGPRAYEWTHSFLSVEPDSASLAYGTNNLSGLWTEQKESQCPRRDVERLTWTEIWALNYHVTGIVLKGLVYSVTVTPEERGYEIIQFRRPSELRDSLTVLEFVTPDGAIVDKWKESIASVFVPVGR